ncbi:GIY-YIG nuclease family protein [Vulcanococcus limneticus]|uniref:GIY-YIG nuclease family protein n=1 Tax=Vulcanococcus limneticus TaxID=2170428 RepID=UPI00398C0721
MAPARQPRQGSLFGPDLGVDPELGLARGPGAPRQGAGAEGLPLQQRQLCEWQQRLAGFQAPLFAAATGTADAGPASQGSLWPSGSHAPDDASRDDLVHRAAGLDPLALAAQHLQFWRWPSAPQAGAALYFVLDRPPHLEAQPLLLYVGETGRADRRWKGEHDCKSYLAAYGEALQRAELGSQLSIRFWGDAPESVKRRRALEQLLIQRWLPPFNKETRARWATPFTADLD